MAAKRDSIAGHHQAGPYGFLRHLGRIGDELPMDASGVPCRHTPTVGQYIKGRASGGQNVLDHAALGAAPSWSVTLGSHQNKEFSSAAGL